MTEERKAVRRWWKQLTEREQGQLRRETTVFARWLVRQVDMEDGVEAMQLLERQWAAKGLMCFRSMRAEKPVVIAKPGAVVPKEWQDFAVFNSVEVAALDARDRATPFTDDEVKALVEAKEAFPDARVVREP